MARIRIAGTSGASENTIVFSPAGGHSHNGRNSSLIDSTAYSVYDFSPTFVGTEVNPDRAVRQENNRIAFEDLIKRVVNNSVLAPAGIRLEPGSLNGSLIIANTITANQLAANTITADEIAAGTITATQLSSNIILVNNIIRINNYNGTIAANGAITANGNTGWAITSFGSAEFSNAVIRGNVTANAGSIGGWTINSNSITAGSTTLFSTGAATFGNTAIAANGQITNGGYTLSNTGVLTATGANISGSITATTLTATTNGRIGPFDITADSFKSTSYNSQNYMEILNYGDIAIYSSPLDGGHANMRHRTDLVGEYIQVARLAGYGTNAPAINRYINLGSSNGAPGNIGIEIVEDNVSKFRVYQDGNLTTAGFVAVGGTGITDAGSVSANGWFRSTGATGWYNQTYGGGIYMIDTTWVRVYNNKNFYTNGVIRAETSLQVAGNATADNGWEFRPWTANANYMSIATLSMSGAEYCMLADGTNTFIGAGTSGNTYIRGAANDSSGQVRVTAGTVEVLGTFFIPSISVNDSTDYVMRRASDGAFFIKSSHRDLKENISTIPDALSTINKLSPMTFNWKLSPEDSKDQFNVLTKQTYKSMGFILEDVLEVSPELVTWRTNKEDDSVHPGYWKIDDFIALAIQGIKDLSKKVSDLESELSILKG
jgi:hypothetical protein